MYEISQPLGTPFKVFIFAIGGHIQCALPNEGLGIGWHISEIVHDHEHLHHGSQWVEQCYLYRPGFRHIVSLLSQIDVTLNNIDRR